jgi:hypothetical protein
MDNENKKVESLLKTYLHSNNVISGTAYDKLITDLIEVKSIWLHETVKPYLESIGFSLDKKIENKYPKYETI